MSSEGDDAHAAKVRRGKGGMGEGIVWRSIQLLRSWVG